MTDKNLNFSYTVIGVGAIGGYYGALLQRAGGEVHYLLHSDYDHVKNHGLSVSSIEGDFSLPRVMAYNSPRDMPRCDVAVVALKATANHILPEILPHVLNEKGIVLLMQNGYGQEELLVSIAGVKTIVSGLCFICSTKTGPGAVCHQDYGSVLLAQYGEEGSPMGVTESMGKMKSDLMTAGVDVDTALDLIEARWKKLMWNIPFSGLTTLFDIDTARVVNSPPLQRLARRLMDEVMEGAASLGRTIPAYFADKMMENTLLMRPYFPSMKLDFDAGREPELEAMFKKPFEAAAARGKSLRLIEMLYEELSFLWEKKR